MLPSLSSSNLHPQSRTVSSSSSSIRSFNSDCGIQSSRASDGPFASSAATSSVPSAHATPAARSSKTAPLIDLEKFIALGSLVFKNEVSGPEEWTEVTVESIPEQFQEHPIHVHATGLLQASWIRLFIRVNRADLSYSTIRVFLLPDDVARTIVNRSDKKVRANLRALMVYVDKSPEAWDGLSCPTAEFPTYTTPSGEQDSLFYIFNTLASPNPSTENVSDRYAAEAIDEVLSASLQTQGLKTEMYPYQRRSVAEMIRRESAPSHSLDPRLEPLVGPTQREFFFDRDSGHVLSDKRTFEDARGGILGETMGYGKTLICLATILATRNTLPEVPPHQLIYTSRHGDREGARSLAEMAAAAAARHNVPWKLAFAELENEGQFHGTCLKVLEKVAGTYENREDVQLRRKSETVVRNFHVCSTTLVVVPPNLFAQWKEEIAKHLEDTALSILIVEERRYDLPNPTTLAGYDMVLMTRTRFEEETRGRRSWDQPSGVEDGTATCQCHLTCRVCKVHDYRSPLLDCHFLRFIVDEGQGFVSIRSKTHALAGLESIRVDRKWVVSGTPTSGLIGVEVDLAAEESNPSESRPGSTGATPAHLCPSSQDSPSNSPVQKTLMKRKTNPAFDDEKKDIERLGKIVENFLQMKPWANDGVSGDAASWKMYVVPNSSNTRKPVSLRNVLSSIVVRHRIEDIESDLQLPPLFNKIIKLQPGFMDKISINLFILMLATNAITSERTDQDYMFHPKNKANLEALIKNMRSSAFFWTGFTQDDVDKTCHAGQKYLDDSTHTVSNEDRELLEKAMDVGRTALSSEAWVIFSKRSEIGLYIERFPGTVVGSWALYPQLNKRYILLGATQLEVAKQSIERNLYAFDPFSHLVEDLTQDEEKKNASATALNKSPQKKGSSQKNASNPGKSIPKSSVQETLKLTSGQFSLHSSIARRSSFSGSKKGTKRKASVSVSQCEPRPPSVLKTRTNSKPRIPSSYKALATTRLAGTSSAKLSYLIDRILELQAEEKILVFYESDYIAYYCAQALEILSVPHLIYASGISLELRTEYQNTFNNDDTYRVMLMDIKQAAHGLHIASASRVFFINPVWQPNIEAQAIKRAHRIGQTRPVYVETLVLQDTIEERMLERRKNMTTQEHQRASKSLLDDETMADMIKNMKIIPLTATEKLGQDDQFVPLKEPQQVFARSIASQYTEEELQAASITNNMQENKNLSTTDLPDRPAKKRQIMFADEAERDHEANSTAGNQADPACRFPSLDRIHNTQQHARNGPDVVYSSAGQPPLEAVAPRKTIRFDIDD